MGVRRRHLGFQGRDLIIGGTGGDTIDGQSGEDLLIPGTTRYDASSSSLRIILNEWTSANPYQTRIDNLRIGVSRVRLQASGIGRTVFNDAAVDSLFGSTNDDWYFRHPRQYRWLVTWRSSRPDWSGCLSTRIRL